MFKSMTFDVIMERMLSKVPNAMDKREGSIIYDALAPAAAELTEAYIQLDAAFNESFADTQTRPYLIRRAGERGIKPKTASKAVLKGVFTPSTLEIRMNSRFNLDDLNYSVIGKISAGVYRLECETEGAAGNEKLGNLIPINYISGLETAQITELMIPGEDEEDTENLRKRYFDSFSQSSYGGNIADYIEKANSISGVGATKVTPAWQGGGTVLLTILDSECNAASASLVKEVQNIIDPAKDASGIGVAPIGHIVTVRTADIVPVAVSCSIAWRDGYSFSGAKNQIEAVMNAYLQEIRQQWSELDFSTVRILQVESRLLNNVDGIVDISNTKLNGVAANLNLGAYEIPSLGGVTDV